LPPVKVRDPQFWETIIAGMVHVIEGGTAHKIGIGAKYRIAGKTGTAQVFTLGQSQRYDAKRLAKHLLDHALFIAFAPVDNPRIAVAVIAENGGGGSSTAAPMARKVMDAWLLNKYDALPEPLPAPDAAPYESE
jgi:penicillin-binding protein 2